MAAAVWMYGALLSFSFVSQELFVYITNLARCLVPPMFACFLHGITNAEGRRKLELLIPGPCCLAVFYLKVL